MALSELVFHNSKRRDRLCRLNQTFLEKMNNNFRATNKLSEVLNENFSCKFQPIAVDKDKTVKENCDIFLEAVKKIQVKIEEIDSRLKEKLEPSCYQEILAMKMPSTETLRKAQAVLEGIAGISLVVFGALKCLGPRLSLIVSPVLGVSACIGSLVLSVLGLGLELVFGAIEKSRLDDAIRKHEKVLEEFGPASDAYHDGIVYVTVKIEIMTRHT
ncbi:SMCO3 protein, partial [Amia calva]|nr:SMCO3 protein [Amia calva]